MAVPKRFNLRDGGHGASARRDQLGRTMIGDGGEEGGLHEGLHGLMVLDSRLVPFIAQVGHLGGELSDFGLLDATG